MINPSMRRKTASTRMIKMIFSLGLTKISSPQVSVACTVSLSTELSRINSTLLGMMGVHLLMALVPLVGTTTVNCSMKLLLLPMPI